MHPEETATSRGQRGRVRLVRLALAGCLALASAAILAPATNAQVTVDELEVHLQLMRERAPLTQVIPVRNEESRPQQVRISVGDWFRDSLGSNVFVEAGTTAGTCGDRVRVFPQTFQLAPGATELVRVAYAPTPADTGCWSIVFIETVKPPPARPTQQGSFLTIEVRTGVKVYVHRPEPQRAGEVQDATVGLAWRIADASTGRADSIQVREASVRFANTGTAHLRVKTSLEVRSLDAKLIHSGVGQDAPMVPGSVRQIRLRIPALPAGDYVAIVLLDYGGDDVAAAQVEFRVP